MIDIPTALGSFKVLMDIAQGMKNLSDATTINSAVIELQTKILAAQSAQMTLISRVSELEQEIVSAKDWDAEKQRYELKAIDTHAVAYVLKAGMENGEPPHWLCPNCFSRRQKSYLQFKGQDMRQGGSRGDTSTYACDCCKSSFKVSFVRKSLKATTEGFAVILQSLDSAIGAIEHLSELSSSPDTKP